LELVILYKEVVHQLAQGIDAIGINKTTVIATAVFDVSTGIKAGEQNN
jgi:hypothetical protein